MKSAQSLFLENHENEKRNLHELLDPLPSVESRLAGLNIYHGFKGHVNNRNNPLSIPFEGQGMEFRAVCRSGRAGRLEPLRPPIEWDGDLAYGGCVIAEENVVILQNGRQVPYRWPVNRRPYVFLEQPESFKFCRRHFTLASLRDEAQGWRPGASVFRARILDLHAAAAALPSYVLLWNGVDAGASIPDRYHVHVVPRDGRTLAIQQAAWRMTSLRSGPSVLRLSEEVWPLAAFRVTGPPEFVADEMLRLARGWSRAAGARATESVAAFVEDGHVVFIYVPRDRKRERSETFGAAVGAYEAAVGVFVFGSEEQCRRMTAGEMGFEKLWQILREVRPEMECNL